MMKAMVLYDNKSEEQTIILSSPNLSGQIKSRLDIPGTRQYIQNLDISSEALPEVPKPAAKIQKLAVQ